MQFFGPNIPPDAQRRFLLEVKQMPQWVVSSEALTTQKVCLTISNFAQSLATFVLNFFIFFLLRWLDWNFLAGYLPRLSLNYVGMSTDMEKRLPQLYYIKMKISYDLGFIAIGVAMAA